MLNRSELEKAVLQQSKNSFWTYCRLTSPDFYKPDRPFLRDLCKQMQAFIEDPDKNMMVIGAPPRHGKSRTATKFTQWLFGKYGKNIKVMTGSYNETLSESFARQVRDVIMEEPGDNSLVYRDIFQDVNVKRGESAVKKWALAGSSQANYLATSPGGTATGFGCTVMIIDDIIKNKEEAYNENVLARHIDWFNNTMLSRTEGGFKIILIMTRWATGDLAGHVLDTWDNVVHLLYKTPQDDGTMLCDAILNRHDFELKTKNMSKEIISANYRQEPIDIKGRLYTGFKTYTDIPRDEAGKPLFKYRLNYTDTADEGSDNLCSICYGVGMDGFEYILDVLYTKEPMEITEPATARMCKKNDTVVAIIESNNGGRGFARAVEKEMRRIGCNTVVTWFHQNQNKKARILSNSTGVMNTILFPVGWMDKWPEFADHLIRYQKEGKNAHDDAEDCLTGVYENQQPRGSAQLKTFKI